ncbi:hypothetical protein [Pseudidiomarina salilacus]|uniref:hypothetical protein n=1 Tax=Pseudidiomarina salilacus TaxID=3384452 RepID=UPI003984EC65
MNDEKLARALQSVGQSCFVKFFDFFSSKSLSTESIIEKLKLETNYTENSCVSRTGHARRIIRAGKAGAALKIIISSNSKLISIETRQNALKCLRKIEST